MPHRTLRTTLWALTVLFLVTACITPAAAGARKLKVAVSILPQAYFVERIGGNRVELQVIMPKYADHDSFEPTPKQLLALSQADIYIKIGIAHFNFEQKYVDPLAKTHKGITIVNMAEGIPIRPDDPHIWISPDTVKLSACNVYKSLVSRDPASKEFFKNNLDVFLKEIVELDSRSQKLFSGKKGASFLIFHPALGYFAGHYGLKQMVIDAEGKPPSALQLRRLVDEAKAKKINIILVQKGIDHKSAAAIAEEIHARLIDIDPMEKNWLSNTWDIAQKVTEALGQ